jgi:hypothetical protein
VVVRVNGSVIAFFPAHSLKRPIGDHLIGIHIGGGAGAALNDVDDKLIVKPAVQNIVAGTDDYRQNCISG